jgi:hypothetical protein
MSLPSEPTTKRMRLRYDGRCRICQVALPTGTGAVYDPATKLVTCADCAGNTSASAKSPIASDSTAAITAKLIESPVIASSDNVDVTDEPDRADPGGDTGA